MIPSTEDDGRGAIPSLAAASLCRRDGVPRVLRGVFLLDGVFLELVEGVRGSRLVLLVLLRGVLGDDITSLLLHTTMRDHTFC